MTTGLAGSVDTLGENWVDLLEALGNTEPFIVAVNALSGLLALTVDGLTDSTAELKEELKELQETGQQGFLTQLGLNLLPGSAGVALASRAAAFRKAEIESILAGEVTAQKRADEGLRLGQLSRLSNTVFEISQKTSKALDDATLSAVEKIRIQSQETIDNLERIRQTALSSELGREEGERLAASATQAILEQERFEDLLIDKANAKKADKA